MFIVKDIIHWLSRRRLKLIVLLAAAAWSTVWVWPSTKLKIIFCSVGQGDAAVVSRGFTQVLIDAGPPSSKTSDCLSRHLPFFDRRLEAVIVSHPQTDHFGGLPQVLGRYLVEKFIFNGLAGDSRAWADLSRLVEKEGSRIITLSAGDKLKIGQVEIDVLWPKKSCELCVMGYGSGVSSEDEPSQPVLGVASSRDLNADGLVFKLAYGNFSALFTGDIGEREEIEMAKTAAMAKTAENSNHSNRSNHLTVLKVAHHGSKTSSSVEFLAAVRPELAVIEVGKNSYGHPADEVIERLTTVGARVLRTDKDGDVVVETDGEKWQVTSKN